jgi:hypothetical protein
LKNDSSKYEEVFREINFEIQKFNELLAEQFKIPLLNFSNPECCAVIAETTWEDQVWPSNKDFPGVYILCGFHENNPSRLGVYIGKAFLNNISNRLSFWLNPYRTTGVYRKEDRSGGPASGEDFIIEVIGAIGLRDQEIGIFAEALEQFIISGVSERKRIYLLNKIGN